MESIYTAKETFGNRLARFRKERGMTQDNIADRLNISAQAVSKWENDLTSPDIDTLLKLSDIFDVTLDELMGKTKIETRSLSESELKDINNMIFKIVVDSSEGDKVRVNLPMALVRVIKDSGLSNSILSGKKWIESIDFEQLINLVERGLVGELITVDSADGDHIRIFVE